MLNQSLKISLIHRLGNLSLGEKVRLQSRKDIENVRRLAEEKLHDPRRTLLDEWQAKDALEFVEEVQRQIVLGNVELEPEKN